MQTACIPLVCLKSKGRNMVKLLAVTRMLVKKKKKSMYKYEKCVQQNFKQSSCQVLPLIVHMTFKAEDVWDCWLFRHVVSTP